MRKGYADPLPNEGENEFLKELNNLCVLYPDTKHVVSRFKDKFTIENLPELEKQLKELESSGCTGYTYIMLSACFKALTSLKIADMYRDFKLKVQSGVGNLFVPTKNLRESSDKKAIPVATEPIKMVV